MCVWDGRGVTYAHEPRTAVRPRMMREVRMVVMLMDGLGLNECGVLKPNE